MFLDSANPTTSRRRRRFTPIVLIAGVAGAILLSLSLSSTLSAFTASITNSVNTAGVGNLVMQEKTTSGTVVTCNSNDGSTASNAFTCATINKYGGGTTLVPGGSVSTTVTIGNTGTVTPTAFTLTPGTCTPTAGPGGLSDLCSVLVITIKSGATTIATGTPSALATAGAINLATYIPAIGTPTPFTFTVSLPASATNGEQGASVSQPLAWTFTS